VVGAQVRGRETLVEGGGVVVLALGDAEVGGGRRPACCHARQTIRPAVWASAALTAHAPPALKAGALRAGGCSWNCWLCLPLKNPPRKACPSGPFVLHLLEAAADL